MRLEACSFEDLKLWRDDDLQGAFTAFLKSCRRQIEEQQGSQICRVALENADLKTPEDIRHFFETHFQPHRVICDEPHGMVTGYFEPVLHGSWQKTERFCVPIYKMPADLVPLINDTERAKFNSDLTYMRETPDGRIPYPTREEIETGALDGEGLELLYLQDQVDAYFMHVQGSGRILLPDGSDVRITYAAKNGHPYSSIGALLIDRGDIPKEKMSLAAIQFWLRENKDEARKIMWQNKSYIFFRALSGEEGAEGPMGAEAVSLTPGRSLAVDASIHALGTPIWVSAPKLAAMSADGFHRLMIAQDVGSAIRGPERGDIYWGSGDEAGDLAGRTAHDANFFVFLPRDAATAS